MAEAAERHWCTRWCYLKQQGRHVPGKGPAQEREFPWPAAQEGKDYMTMDNLKTLMDPGLSSPPEEKLALHNDGGLLISCETNSALNEKTAT